MNDRADVLFEIINLDFLNEMQIVFFDGESQSYFCAYCADYLCMFDKVINQMRQNDRIYCVGLTFIMLLVGLHFSVLGMGFKTLNNRPYPTKMDKDFTLKKYDQFFAFIIVAAFITFFLSLTLICAICTNNMALKTRNILAALNLVFEFAIAVVISMNISNESIERQREINKSGVDILDYDDEYKAYYNLSIADAVITFAFGVVYLLIIYCLTLQDVEAPPTDLQNQQNTANNQPYATNQLNKKSDMHKKPEFAQQQNPPHSAQRLK